MLDFLCMESSRVLAVILARAGSKGLPHKNVHPVGGRPMIAWTIDAAQSADQVDAICVTTNLPEAAAIARDAGLVAIERPAALATDTASVVEATRHAVAEFEKAHGAVSHVALLYANVPVRAPGIIDAAIAKLLDSGADSVRSVSPVGKFHPDWMHRLDGDRLVQFRANSIHRRQDLEPVYYHDGAVVAVARASLFVDDGGDPHAFFGRDRRAVVSNGPTVDVDTIDDARVADALLRASDAHSTETRAIRSVRDSVGRFPSIRIGNRYVGATANPYIIAEIGVNHDGCVKTAQSLIDAALSAGADAVKFQVFDADRLAGKSAKTCQYQQAGDAENTNQREMLRRLELSHDDLLRLRAYCNEARIDFVATPFGLAELGFIAHQLEPAAIKIASPDLVNLPLIDAAAATMQPLIVSTGASDWTEIEAAATRLQSVANDGRLALLHCISAYPTPLERANLATIERMRIAFGIPVGFSDHTTAVDAGALALMAGARILEKHITYDRRAVGPDHAASLEPDAFAGYVEQARRAAMVIGTGDRQCLDIEQEVRNQSRGRLVASRRIPAGATITTDALMVQRPGDGIAPTEMIRFIGRTARTDISAETPLEWTMVDGIR